MKTAAVAAALLAVALASCGPERPRLAEATAQAADPVDLYGAVVTSVLGWSMCHPVDPGRAARKEAVAAPLRVRRNRLRDRLVARLGRERIETLETTLQDEAMQIDYVANVCDDRVQNRILRAYRRELRALERRMEQPDWAG